MGMPYRVLLVEDDRDLAVSIQMALSSRRWEVRVASSLGQALESLRVLPAPDVVVAELALHEGPPMNHLIEELARDRHLAEVPVALLSSWEGAVALAEFHGLPAGSVLPKPLDLRRFEAKLEALMRHAVPTDRAPFRLPVRADAPHRTGADY